LSQKDEMVLGEIVTITGPEEGVLGVTYSGPVLLLDVLSMTRHFIIFLIYFLLWSEAKESCIVEV